MSDTIFALASGSARAGVAVVRVSGPAAKTSIENLAGRVPEARIATLMALRDGDALLDRAVVLFFENPKSFTGEDVAEFHLHGGRAVIDGVLAALARVAGCRPAGPGEFTRRAYENGKTDLTGAEAIADLIAAETAAQREQALMQMGGALADIYNGWAEELKNMLAHQEAEIEFPDEDLPDGIATGLSPRIAALRNRISAHLGDARRGEMLRDGLRIAIVGAPNAGKSSLLNALSRREAAIVSDEAGTTRDVVTVHLDLGGFPVIISDTAGLRETENKIEAEGVRRAKLAAGEADLKIALFDANAPEDAATRALVDDETMVVYTKADTLSESTPAKAGGQRALPTGTGISVEERTGPPLSRGWKDGGMAFLISSQTGEGMEAFLFALSGKVKDLFGARDNPAPTRARHRAALEEAQGALDRALEAHLPELAAEDLRLALRALGRITGTVHVEEVLDAVFRDFCIGK